MTCSTADRARIIVVSGALVLIVASVALGLHEHWTLALPAVGLLRFCAWILRGLYAVIPVFAAGALITHLSVRRAADLPRVTALALRWGLGSAAVTVVGIIMLATGTYSPVVWQLLALLGWLGILGWLIATRSKLLLEGWDVIRGWRTAMPPLICWESFLIVLGVMSAVAAFLPPDTRDELAYHLVLPKLWGFQGNWWVPVTNFHLLFPANTEILWGWSMATGGLLAPRFVTLLFAGLTVALLWEWLDSQPGGSWSRNLALALLLTTPLALSSASICYVEWPLMFFLLLGWRLSRLGGVLGARASMWTTAMAWGMSLGMKYTAILFAGLLALEWLGGLWRKNRRRAVTALIALGVSACVFAAPWLVRNLIATGDPVVPLGSAIGLGHTPHEDATGLIDYVHLRGLWRLMPTVYHATADPLADHRLHPAWPLILLAVIALGWRWRGRLPWVTVTVSTIVLMPFSPSPRVELPLLVLSTLFIPALLDPFRSRAARNLATLTVIIVAVISIPISAYFLLADGGPAIPKYLLGLIGPRAYLSERGVLTPAMQWTQEQTPRNVRIWVWCDDRVFYFDRWVRPDAPFQPPAFLSRLRHGGAAALTRSASDVDFIAVRRDHCPATWTTASVEKTRWKIGAANRKILKGWMGSTLTPVFRGPRYTIYTHRKGP